MKERDIPKEYRVIGQMMAAEAILKQARGEIDHEDKRGLDLLDIAQKALGAATLAVWERAELSK